MDWTKPQAHEDSAAYYLQSGSYRISRDYVGEGWICVLYRVGQQPPPIAIGDLDLCKRAAEAHGRGE